jgi:hypothetical protein
MDVYLTDIYKIKQEIHQMIIEKPGHNYNAYHAIYLGERFNGKDPSYEELRAYSNGFNEVVNEGLVFAKLQLSEAHYYARSPSDIVRKRLRDG